MVITLAGTLLATCLISGSAKATSVPVLKGDAIPGIVTLVGRGGGHRGGGHRGGGRHYGGGGRHYGGGGRGLPRCLPRRSWLPRCLPRGRSWLPTVFTARRGLATTVFTAAVIPGWLIMADAWWGYGVGRCGDGHPLATFGFAVTKQ